jgi:drug/metabolite transporter (DMT)-like permease
MPPLSLNLFKNSFAMVFLPPTMLLMGEPFIPELTPTVWAVFLASGFLGIAVADSMFFFSLEKLGAGLTAVVDTSYTPIMLGMSYAFLGEDMEVKNLSGAALIMGGLLVGSVTRPEEGKTRKDLLLGMAVGIGGIALMGVSLIMIKPYLDGVPTIWATTVRLLAGTVGLLPIIAAHPGRRSLMGALRPSASWKKAIPAALFGTYLAMIAWIAGMKFIEVHRAALLNQLSTIFIFILAAVVLKEAITKRRVAAVALAAGGAFLVAY